MKLISFIVGRDSFGTRAKCSRRNNGRTFVGRRQAERSHLKREGQLIGLSAPVRASRKLEAATSQLNSRRDWRRQVPAKKMSNNDALVTSKNAILTLLLTFRPRVAVWLWFCVRQPALTFVLTFRPRETVWLCCGLWLPALTLVLTFRPRDIVWLWFGLSWAWPALMFDLIYIPVLTPIGC